MPTFFSRFGAESPRWAPYPVEDLPVAIYCEDLDAPVWGTARDLSAERISIATPSVFPVASIARIVLHGRSAPISVEAEGLWQRYEDGEHAILTGFQLARLTRAKRRRFDELAGHALHRIASILAEALSVELDLEGALALASIVHCRRIRPGRVIRSEAGAEDHLASLFVVEEGRVSLHLAGGESKSRALDSVERGGLFGGIAPPAAPLREVAVAECDTRLLEIDSCGFDRVRERDSHLALRLATAAFRSASLRYCEALLAEPESRGQVDQAS